MNLMSTRTSVLRSILRKVATRRIGRVRKTKCSRLRSFPLPDLMNALGLGFLSKVRFRYLDLARIILMVSSVINNNQVLIEEDPKLGHKIIAAARKCVKTYVNSYGSDGRHSFLSLIAEFFPEKMMSKYSPFFSLSPRLKLLSTEDIRSCFMRYPLITHVESVLTTKPGHLFVPKGGFQTRAEAEAYIESFYPKLPVGSGNQTIVESVSGYDWTRNTPSEIGSDSDSDSDYGAEYLREYLLDLYEDESVRDYSGRSKKIGSKKTNPKSQSNLRGATKRNRYVAVRSGTVQRTFRRDIVNANAFYSSDLPEEGMTIDSFDSEITPDSWLLDPRATVHFKPKTAQSGASVTRDDLFLPNPNPNCPYCDKVGHGIDECVRRRFDIINGVIEGDLPSGGAFESRGQREMCSFSVHGPWCRELEHEL